MSIRNDDVPTRLLRSTSLPPDAVYDALNSARRREVLSVLATGPLPMGTAELARAVAARETATTRDAVPDELVTRIRVGLYHSHLPRLADHGIIEYDDDTVTAIAWPLEPDR